MEFSDVLPAPAPTVGTRACGLNIPPPDVIDLIEHTVMMLADTDAKFYFLRPHDLYHNYYQRIVSELAAQSPATDASATVDAPPEKPNQYEPRVEQIHVMQVTAEFAVLYGRSFLADLACRKLGDRLFDLTFGMLLLSILIL